MIIFTCQFACLLTISKKTPSIIFTFNNNNNNIIITTTITTTIITIIITIITIIITYQYFQESDLHSKGKSGTSFNPLNLIYDTI